jgi:hypothetical protein
MNLNFWNIMSTAAIMEKTSTIFQISVKAVSIIKDRISNIENSINLVALCENSTKIE